MHDLFPVSTERHGIQKNAFSDQKKKKKIHDLLCMEIKSPLCLSEITDFSVRKLKVAVFLHGSL